MAESPTPEERETVIEMGTAILDQHDGLSRCEGCGEQTPTDRSMHRHQMTVTLDALLASGVLVPRSALEAAEKEVERLHSLLDPDIDIENREWSGR